MSSCLEWKTINEIWPSWLDDHAKLKSLREEMFYLIICFNFIDNDGSMHMISDSIACTLEVHVDDMHHGPGCFHVYILFMLQISNNKLESYNNTSTIILGRTLHAHLYHLSFFTEIDPMWSPQPVWYSLCDTNVWIAWANMAGSSQGRYIVPVMSHLFGIVGPGP